MIQNDVIAAIATPLLQGALGVVRISGSGAIETADRIFRSKRGVSLCSLRGYTAAFGEIVEDEKPVDECVALVFKAPHSYTGEDVVELSCHGGVYLLRRVLHASLSAGARMALPGEFTRRAFLNGRLDLTQAEAVMDIIGAQGEDAARAALSQCEGSLSLRIGAIKNKLVSLSGDIAAWVDFPEEGIPSLEPKTLINSLFNIKHELDGMISGFDSGRVIREGISAVIAGSPNVGKSTLMNALAGFEKSIVTDIPGTTRDIVEETVNFAGITLKLSDTAGLRETQDPVEKIGVGRARTRFESAQLVFAVFDGCRALSDEDISLLNQLEGRKAVAVINKSDLPQIIDKEYITKITKHIVELSASTGAGIAELEAEVKSMMLTESIDPNAAMLANERQLECAIKARDCADEAYTAAKSGMTLDAVSVGVEGAVSALCELTGELASDEIINNVFERFCVGK